MLQDVSSFNSLWACSFFPSLCNCRSNLGNRGGLSLLCWSWRPAINTLSQHPWLSQTQSYQNGDYPGKVAFHCRWLICNSLCSSQWLGGLPSCWSEFSDVSKKKTGPVLYIVQYTKQSKNTINNTTQFTKMKYLLETLTILPVSNIVFLKMVAAH